jgi:uncharacterized protein
MSLRCLTLDGVTAETVIRRLALAPHPEGGHFRETYRHSPPDGGRGALTHIYYLLREGERSAWHWVDATEVWHHYAGAPLLLHIEGDDGQVRAHRLGDDVDLGEELTHVVPAGRWQSAEPLGAWTLVGCTVAPAFDFGGFELGAPGWSPPSQPGG